LLQAIKLAVPIGSKRHRTAEGQGKWAVDRGPDTLCTRAAAVIIRTAAPGGRNKAPKEGDGH